MPTDLKEWLLEVLDFFLFFFEYKIINIPLDNCINQSLKCAGCIAKTQQKHSLLKQSIPHY